MGKRLVTCGSVSREEAASLLPFLSRRYPGRRTEIRGVTHQDPWLVFWIDPDGHFIDARDGHLRNPPRGRADILKDEPEYGGFLRGRVANYAGTVFIVVYCRADALELDLDRIQQFVSGVTEMPVPISDEALVISDNGDLYGRVADLVARADARAELNGSLHVTRDALHDDLVQALSLPAHYGRNLDALWDVLTGGLDLPLAVTWQGFGASQVHLGDYADEVLGVLRAAESEQVGLRVVLRD